MNTVLVLMSTYNGEKYLGEQLESIYRQIDVKVKRYYDGIFDNAGKKKVYSSRCKKVYDIVKNDISNDKKYYYKMICNYDKTALSAFKLATKKDVKKITKKVLDFSRN